MDILEIIKICQVLTSEGKNPTVALIKARMSGPKPLPLIISALKQFQSNPKQFMDELADNHDTEELPLSFADTSGLSHEALIKRVLVLESEVATLKSAIFELENRLTLLDKTR